MWDALGCAKVADFYMEDGALIHREAEENILATIKF